LNAKVLKAINVNTVEGIARTSVGAAPKAQSFKKKNSEWQYL
jgi:hypothetical protein